MRGSVQILKKLWSKEENASEVTTSYQYVLELRKRLDETMKLAQAELEKNQIRNTKLYNRKVKKRVFQLGDKVLVLLPTDYNNLLMQWKGPFEFKGCKRGNNYQIEVSRKMKTIYINLLKQFVESDNVDMTATPDQRNFPWGAQERKPGWELGSRSRVSRQQIGKNVVGASADYVKEQEHVRVDDEKLLELEVLRPKENNGDACLEMELSRKQQNEIMGVLGKRKKILTDIPGKTSIIEHRVHLVDNCPITCRPYALPYAVQKEIQEEILEIFNTRIVRESNSPYASTMVVVKKKDGSSRICVDYRKLNRITVSDPVPIFLKDRFE